MKRFFCLLLTLVLGLFPVACTQEETGVSAGEFRPLFRIHVPESGQPETRLFRCDGSDGYFYLHREGEGVSGGFVSVSRSLSGEALLREEASSETFLLREIEKDRAFLLSDTTLYTVLFESGVQKTALPQGFRSQGAMFYNDLSVLTVEEGLILLRPLDFSETYVLADTARLPDFESLLAVTENGKKIWYRKGTPGAFSGIGFFEYGSNLPLGEEKISFTSAVPVGEEGILLTCPLEDGGVVYQYRNLATGQKTPLVADVPFTQVSVSSDGSVLAGLRTGEAGPVLEVYDLSADRLILSHPVTYGTPVGLQCDGTGQEILLAVASGDDVILGRVLPE